MKTIRPKGLTEEQYQKERLAYFTGGLRRQIPITNRKDRRVADRARSKK
jgi:hypothetical protein